MARKKQYVEYVPVDDADLALLKICYSGDDEAAFGLLEITLKHDPFIVGRAIKAAKPASGGDHKAWDRILTSLQDFAMHKFRDEGVRLGWYIEWLDTYYPMMRMFDYEAQGMSHEEDTIFGGNENSEVRFTGISCIPLD